MWSLGFIRILTMSRLTCNTEHWQVDVFNSHISMRTMGTPDGVFWVGLWNT